MSEAAASGPIKMANGSYPISDQKSANSAWKLRRHSKDYSEAQVVAHIRTACNTLGLTFPGTSEKSAEYQRSLGLQRSGGFVSDLREKYGPRQNSDVPVNDNGVPNGCMVAFYPPTDVAASLAVPGGEPVEEMHVTLAFLGTAPEDPDTVSKLRDAVAAFAASSGPVTGEFSGLGLFTGGENPVTYASVDCPALPEFRQSLVASLDAAGFPPNKTHGYTPHMTLAYSDERTTDVPATPVSFDTLYLVVGPERFGFPLNTPEAAAIKPKTNPGYDAETEVVNKNKKHPNAKKKHPFTPGQHPTPNGAQRCLQCGNTNPQGGVCPAPADVDGNETVSDKIGPQIVPVQSALDDAGAGKVAAGIDAGVDQALVLLRSTPDLLPYAAQARDVLQGIEPACDELLEYFGMEDPDDDDSDASEAEQAASHPKKHKHKYVHPSRVGLRPGMAGWFGHGLCAACGQSKDDPDHDGDVDTPGGADSDGDAQTAAFTPFIGGFTLQTNTTSWPTTTTSYVLPTQVAYTEPRLAKPALPYLAKPDSNSFVTELNGKTLITTQAAVSKELADAMTPHQHMLWTTGRLVGADQPNRNGAYWSSSDLQTGKATVPYGPLNWLHEERHVIGTLAAAEYVPVDPGNELADGSGTAQNHIAVAAPIWKWLYPDEADVLEMASDAGKFWYSMECISRSVACIGENGCGAEVGYFDYMQGINGTCAHMVQHSATRQFVDPIFLGAAVIVPPVRPGWADADASITRQAASLAEKAFDDAGQPDMSASEWEQLMAQVVSFATC